MKHILTIIFSFFLTFGVVWAQEQQFFETLYDVPVMDGLAELPDMALSFDKPNGRIAEAGAISKTLSHETILSFYNTTLKQLGWELKKSTPESAIYHRESEKLSILLDKSEGISIISFTLEPIEG